MLRSEAFGEALAEFCSGDEPQRLGCSRPTAARGLRRMLTGVYETLRAAGRELELELGSGLSSASASRSCARRRGAR